MSDVVRLALDLLRPNATVVLVAPDDEIDRIIEHAFGNVRLDAVLNTVLVNQEHVEPIILRNAASFRHVHLDAVGSQLVVHAAILDIADAVHCEVCCAFAQQDRPDPDARVFRFGRLVCRQLNLAKVVERARHRQHVKRAKGTLRSSPLRIIVVAVDGEDRNADIEIRVLVVNSRKAKALATY